MNDMNPKANKSKEVQQQLLLNLITVLFTPTKYFNFIANSSLDACIDRIQKEGEKIPPTDGGWFFYFTKLKVTIQPYPANIIEFVIQTENTGRYRSKTKIIGYLEALNETSTMIRGQSNQSGFIRRMATFVFLVLWGLSTEKLWGFLFLSVVGLLVGPITNFLIKKSHIRYMKSIFDNI